MLKKLFLLLITFPFTVKGQESFQTEFYRFTTSINSEVSVFNSVNEESSNINGYKFRENGRLKYIFYLISNKLNADNEVITIDNYKSFIFDLGDIEITSIDTNITPIKLVFNYKDNTKVTGLLYISINGNILNRFVLVLPNLEGIYEKYNDEINNLVQSTINMKSNW